MQYFTENSNMKKYFPRKTNLKKKLAIYSIYNIAAERAG